MYCLAETDVLGEDADGETGTYTATFQCVPNPSTRLEIEIGVPLDGRPLFTITANYSPWPKHHRLRVQTFGVREDQAAPSVGAIPYVLYTGSSIRPLKQRVCYVGTAPYGLINWRDSIGEAFYGHPKPGTEGKFEIS